MKIIRKCYSFVFLIFSILFLFYVIKKSKFFFDISRIEIYYPYIILSLLLLVISIFSFFLNKNKKDYLIIISISVVTSLYLFEAYLGTLSRDQEHKKRVELINKSGKRFDTRRPFEIFNDLKKTNKDISYTVAPIYFSNNKFELFPLSGVSKKDTILCNENGYYAIFKSDRYGFNNPDQEWDEEKIEYLILGDSFAIGACVNRPYDIGSLLRSMSNKSVLNLAYNGSGPLLQYIALREYMYKKVKKVIWLYYEGNDLSNLDFELNEKRLQKYLTDLNYSQNLKKKQKKIDEISNNVILNQIKKIEDNRQLKNKNYFHELIYFLKLTKFRAMFGIKRPREIQPEFEKIISLAKELIQKNDAELYFVYLTSYNRYKIHYDRKNSSDTTRLGIKKIIDNLNIPFIDLHTDLFEKEENPLNLFPMGLSGHYNKSGYDKISRIIFKASNK